MIGMEIGCYRILEKLGQGGMGVVYKAVDTGLDRMVAMKVLNPDLSQNPELVSRFQSEAKAQANLNHTNLATLYAFLVHQGTAMMVMEFVEGETFSQMIRRRGPIPEREAIPLFMQALLGIGYAHRAGIIHRDIKPSNLMLNKNGIVKVMDFGIAKVMGARGMTRTGAQLGTLAYMSPEQIQNRNVDIRSDIYELGITLYEMLTGHLPFESDSEFQIMQDQVFAPPPFPTKYYPYINKGTESVILKSIEKNPDSRFQTVEQFGAALEHPDALPYTPPVDHSLGADDAATASLSSPAPTPYRPAPSTPSTPSRPSPPSRPPASSPAASYAPPSAASYGAPPMAPTVPASAPGSYAPPMAPTRMAGQTIAQPPTQPPPYPQAPPAPAGNQKKVIIIAICAVLVVLVGGVAAYQAFGPSPSGGHGAAVVPPPSKPLLDTTDASPNDSLPPDVVPPSSEGNGQPNPGASSNPAPKSSPHPPATRPKSSTPSADQGQQMMQKARAAYAQGRLFDPPNDCALRWAIEARKSGNPGGKALEEQLLQAYKDHVAQFYQQRNYPAALNLVNAMLKFYPGDPGIVSDQRKIQAAANSAHR